MTNGMGGIPYLSTKVFRDYCKDLDLDTETYEKFLIIEEEYVNILKEKRDKNELKKKKK
jgi:hypothetical protein